MEMTNNLIITLAKVQVQHFYPLYGPQTSTLRYTAKNKKACSKTWNKLDRLILLDISTDIQ